MHGERLEVSVSFDPRQGYIASAPELKAPLRRRIQALMLPDEVRVVLQLDRAAAWSAIAADSRRSRCSSDCRRHDKDRSLAPGWVERNDAS
jgi:hypothetical protein